MYPGTTPSAPPPYPPTAPTQESNTAFGGMGYNNSTGGSMGFSAPQNAQSYPPNNPYAGYGGVSSSSASPYPPPAYPSNAHSMYPNQPSAAAYPPTSNYSGFPGSQQPPPYPGTGQTYPGATSTPGYPIHMPPSYPGAVPAYPSGGNGNFPMYPGASPAYPGTVPNVSPMYPGGSGGAYPQSAYPGAAHQPPRFGY